MNSKLCNFVTVLDHEKYSQFLISYKFTYYRFWTHLVMAYVFTFWTCYILRKEYEIVASMRLHFLASENRRPDQYTVRLALNH